MPNDSPHSKGSYSKYPHPKNSSNSDYPQNSSRSYGGTGERRQQHPNAERDLQYKREMRQKFVPDPSENLFSVNLPDIPAQFKDPSTAVVNHLGQEQPNLAGMTAFLDDTISRSAAFWEEFPSEEARLRNLRRRNVSEKKLEEVLNSVYPIVHYSTLDLMLNFLNFKRQHGSIAEKKLYQGMTVLKFVDRLIKKRPLSFLGANDQYYLRSPTFKHGYGGFETIGTDYEKYPLVLDEYLSYDEMMLSALISLSSWSCFINDGRRKNYGKIDKPGSFQDTGVIVGQVGSRLKKENVMEYLDCVISRKENVPSNGFGLKNESPHLNMVWRGLWGNRLPTHEEAHSILSNAGNVEMKDPFKIIPCGRDIFFNVTVYKMRMAITAEILLCEANTRAGEAGKKAYIHVVGLGLGVWRATPKQDALFVDAWGDAMGNLSNTSNIAFVDFSYIGAEAVHGFTDGQKFRDTGITVRFSQRNLHDHVPKDCYLICNYAWDGNSYPGNEFYLGKLCSTGDSAAACSSMVAEVHNHEINCAVGAEKLHITTREGFVVPWQQFVKGTKVNNPRTIPELSSEGVRQANAPPPSSSTARSDRMENQTAPRQSVSSDTTTVSRPNIPGLPIDPPKEQSNQGKKGRRNRKNKKQGSENKAIADSIIETSTLSPTAPPFTPSETLLTSKLPPSDDTNSGASSSKKSQKKEEGSRTSEKMNGDEQPSQKEASKQQDTPNASKTQSKPKKNPEADGKARAKKEEKPATATDAPLKREPSASAPADTAAPPQSKKSKKKNKGGYQNNSQEGAWQTAGGKKKGNYRKGE